MICSQYMLGVVTCKVSAYPASSAAEGMLSCSLSGEGCASGSASWFGPAIKPLAGD